MNISFNKAQVSVFVIISLIVVIGGIFIVSISSDSIKIFNNDKSSYKVKEYVEECLFVESEKAVDLIGKHGGWLYHREMTFASRDNPEIFNRQAQGVNFLEAVNIPYWFYFNDLKEEFAFNIPEYDTDDEYSLKNQVKLYLEDNLERNCIQNFVDFEDMYKIKYEPKDIKGKINVEFDEDEIVTSLDLPLEIIEKNNDNKEYVDYFEVELENKLWIPYHLALDIVSAEANSYFVEERILDFIGPYQRTDNRAMLPPFYDYKMTYDFRPWDVTEVEDLFKRVVSSHMRLVQFLNTDYNEMKLTKAQQSSQFARGYANIYIKDYLSEYSLVKEDNKKIFRKFSNYKVKPAFDVFNPMSFHLAPSMGDIILLPRPEALLGFIPIFFTEYNAVYEVVMPISFNIESNDPNDKFEFNFFIEANIDHNTPLGENRVADFSDFDFGTSGKNLICDPLQFISAEVSLNITDSVDNGNRKLADPIKGVEDAIVTFDCKGVSTCFVGQTKINGKYIAKNITHMNFRLPINCNPGTLEIYKYGHKKVVIDNLNPSIEEPISLGTIDMPSQKTMKVNLKLVGGGSSKHSTGKKLGEYDTGFVIFTNLEDENIVQVIEADFNNQYNLTVDLTTGNYSVEGFIIYNNNFTIPEDEFCYSTGMFSGKDCETLPEINMSSWVRGGIELERFEIPLNFLLEREEITIPLIDYTVPRSYSELEESSHYMSNLADSSHKPYFD